MSLINLIFIRHGEASDAWDNHPDPGLSKAGINQANELLQRKELRRQKSRSAKAGAARTERSASSSSSPPRRRFWRLSIKRDGEGKRRHRFPQHRERGKCGVFFLCFHPKSFC